MLGMATVAERLAELNTELTEVKTAISGILTRGQSAGMSGMNVGRANLPALYDRRRELEKSIQRLTNGDRGFSVDLAGRADV